MCLAITATTLLAVVMGFMLGITVANKERDALLDWMESEMIEVLHFNREDGLSSPWLRGVYRGVERCIAIVRKSGGRDD